MRNIPKIYNYARVSTTKQLKGVGLETQQQRSVLENLSQKYNLPIHDENFVDQGLSAYHGKHKDGAFGVVLSQIESGEIASGSILVVFSLDRISRETTNLAMAQLLSIINRGVRVYTHIDDKMYDTSNDNFSTDLMFSMFTMERANEESRTKSRRIIAAQKEALKKWYIDKKPQGALGRVPCWIDQPTNKLNQNATGIKVAIDLYLQGWSSIKIKKHLDENYPYKRTRKAKVKTSSTWDLGVIDQLWKKRALIGEKHLRIEGKTHVLKDYYPKLVDLNTYLRLKALREPKKGRATTTGSIHLLKGLAKCGVCGGAMVFIDKGASRQNYVCNLATKGEHQREVVSTRMLEFLTLEVCKDFYLVNKVGATSNTNIEAEIQERILEEKAELSDLIERYKKKARGSLAELIEDQEDKIELLEKELDTFNINIFDEVLERLTEDLYTEEVRNNISDPQRADLHEILCRILKVVNVYRRTEDTKFTKTKKVNCIEIEWVFKSGQARKLVMNPFEYIITENKKSLYIPYEYKHDIPFEEYRRSKSVIPNALKKLHDWNLLRGLYPTKGRYEWNEIDLELGYVHSKTSPNFDAILDGSYMKKGTMYIQSDKNYLEDKDDIFC
ncbi:recombinase family protein [Vibrio parahaemolyticus]